ncbi:MAG: alkaline phosphatase family protein [Polyangiaceae bacterium]
MSIHALRWFVVALAVSLFGAVAGSHLMASLNDPVPGVLEALHANEDPVAEKPRAPHRRVVVVLIDGLGGAPFDARLREGTLGEIPWRASLDSGVPSRSRPVYHAILTGVPQWAAGIRGNGYATGRADSVPDRVRAGGGKVAWMLETVPWFYDLFGAEEDVLVRGRAATSAESFARVWDAGPDFIVLHLAEVDEAGHLHGAASEEYAEASRRAMKVVAEFREVARSKARSDDALWFVGADHGHTLRGGHGGPEEEVRRVSWIALYRGGADETNGPNAAPAGAMVTSLAPTIARALGVDVPRESMADGLPLLPALLGPPSRASEARVRAVETARQVATKRALGSAAARATLVGGALGATFAALISLRRRRGAAETMVFVAAAAGFFVAGPGLSMSSVRTEAWYLAHAVGTLALFAAVAWLVARKWASAMATAVECAVFPFVALVAVRGSLGVSDATPLECVLWPSLGLVPASVCVAIAVVELGFAALRKFSGPV